MRFLASFCLATILSLPAAAQASEISRDVSCLEHGALVAYLDRAYQEAPVADAWLSNGNQVQIFASKRGTWTMVEMTADGFGCIARHGEGLHLVAKPPLKRPAS